MQYDATPARIEPFAAAPPPLVPARAAAVAPWWHTAALFAVLLITTLLGHSRATALTQNVGSRAPQYLTSMLVEWLLLGSVIAGIYHRRAFFLQALRNHATGTWQSLAMGIPAYFSGLLALGVVAGALYYTPLFHKRNEAVVLAMLPHTPLEFIAWFGVSITAGITEELIFRGYLLQQLEAWFGGVRGSGVIAIVVGGLLFGSVHLYEGLGAILPLAALGILYGFIARWMKGDLRAVMVAHTLQDFLVALLVLAKPWAERHQLH